MSPFGQMLAAAFGDTRVGRNVPLRSLTTFRVGGPAEWLLETRGSDEIVAALKLASSAGVSVTMLGGGSNVLVADSGIRGLVIRPRHGDIVRIDDLRVRADAAARLGAPQREADRAADRESSPP